tara:strand:- start:247 stop:429 length:183 start_codon:yes stop_codon:yes gene_type:complete
MAKKQTFESKLNKKDNKSSKVKFIRSNYLKNKQSIRFLEEMVDIPDGKNPEAFLKEHLKK